MMRVKEKNLITLLLLLLPTGTVFYIKPQKLSLCYPKYLNTFVSSDIPVRSC